MCASVPCQRGACIAPCPFFVFLRFTIFIFLITISASPFSFLLINYVFRVRYCSLSRGVQSLLMYTLSSKGTSWFSADVFHDFLLPSLCSYHHLEESRSDTGPYLQWTETDWVIYVCARDVCNLTDQYSHSIPVILPPILYSALSAFW